SLAKSAKVFSGIEAETAGVTQSACFSTLVLSAVSLSCILDNKKPVCPREFQNRIHVRRLPEKMNRDDCLGSCRESLLQLGWVHCERVFVHIHKHRLSSAIGNGLGCGEERVRNHNHFISGPNPKRQESKPKRVCAIAHANGVIGATVGRELLFELLHERSARKRAALDYFANGAI